MFIGHRGLSKPILVTDSSRSVNGWNKLSPTNVSDSQNPCGLSTTDLQIIDYSNNTKFNAIQLRSRKKFIRYHMIGQGGSGGESLSGSWTGGSGQPGEYKTDLIEVDNINEIRVSYPQKATMVTGKAVTSEYYDFNRIIGLSKTSLTINIVDSELSSEEEEEEWVHILYYNDGIPPYNSISGIDTTSTRTDSAITTYYHQLTNPPRLADSSLYPLHNRVYISINTGDHMNYSNGGSHAVGPFPGGMLTGVKFTDDGLPSVVNSASNVMLMVPDSSYESIGNPECSTFHNDKIMFIGAKKSEIQDAYDNNEEKLRGHTQAFGRPGQVSINTYLPLAGESKDYTTSYGKTRSDISNNQYITNAVYLTHYWKWLAYNKNVNISGGEIILDSGITYNNYLTMIKGMASNITTLRQRNLHYQTDTSIDLTLKSDKSTFISVDYYNTLRIRVGYNDYTTDEHVDRKYMFKITKNASTINDNSVYTMKEGGSGLVSLADMPDDPFSYEEISWYGNYTDTQYIAGTSCGTNVYKHNVDINVSFATGGGNTYQGDDEITNFFGSLKDNDISVESNAYYGSKTHDASNTNVPVSLQPYFSNAGKGGDGGSIYHYYNTSTDINYLPSFGRQGLVIYNMYVCI